MQLKANENNKRYEFKEAMIEEDFNIVFNRNYVEKPQRERDFHFHDFYEIYFFKEGAVTFYIEENAYRLMPGDLLIMPPGVMHSKTVDDKLTYERTIIYIKKSVLASWSTKEWNYSELFGQMEQNNKLMFHFNQESQQEMEVLIGYLMREINNEQWGAGLIKKAYMTEFLVRVCRQYEKTDYIAQPLETGNIIPQIISYINEHVTQPITLDTLSELFFISKYHLIRTFKNYTGTTVHNYLVSKKIIFVKKLLDEGCPITEASVKAGFTDYSIFYKAFVRRMNLTPKEYVKRLKH